MLKTPTEVVSIVPPRAKPERTELKVLDAYVETLRLWSSQPTQTNTIRFEHTEVEVLPWAARAIHRFCNAPHPTRGEVEDLVMQGVAVIAKCRTDLASVGNTGDNLHATYALQAEMMLDAAVGSVIVRELQRLGNRLLAEGQNEEVKELNRFQHEVRRNVQQVRGSLSDVERERVSEFQTLLEGPQDEEEPLTASARLAPETPSGPPAAPAPRTRAPKPRVFVDEAPEPSGRFRNYVMRFVLTAMVVGLVAYGVVSLRNSPVQGDASGSLTSAVGALPGVAEVTDRMPYIVLTVRDEFWTDRSESDRRDWIKDLSRMTERHGYSGLVVRSTGGEPLAEWVRGRGIKFGSS